MTDYRFQDGTSVLKDNRGFSLVELIICVAILAVATIPLYQSMTLSARTDAKAQSKQNATSLAESVMEEIKAASVDELKLRYNGAEPSPGEGPVEVSLGMAEDAFFGNAGAEKTSVEKANLAKTAAGGADRLLTGTVGTPKAPFYVLYKHDAVSTQGEKFDVVATLRSSTYMGAENSNASDANSKKLPRIDEIDSLNQAVITTKELSKYDDAALDYFRQNGASIDTSKKISSKEIVIDKDDTAGALYDQVSVNCRVVYKDNSTPVHTYQRDLFSGTFGAPTKVEGGTTTVLPLASNIYIFYKKTTPTGCNEVITVNDHSTKGIKPHKVFLVMQDVGGATLTISETKVIIKNASATLIELDSNSDLNDEGNMVSGDYELITNMTKTGSTDGHIYNEEAAIRIYDISVSLVKDGVEYASLNSTKEVNDENN